MDVISQLVTFLDCKKQQRKQATIDAFNKLQAEALDELNTYTTKNIAEISQNPLSPEYKLLSSLLARCEHFSVGVNEKIYDQVHDFLYMGITLPKERAPLVEIGAYSSLITSSSGGKIKILPEQILILKVSLMLKRSHLE